MSKNIIAICHYGFTEMLNNAIDHSEGKRIDVGINCDQDIFEMTITDDGIGIFNKIRQKFHLEDERHAILELTKGKLTTVPERHSGEGIFFTSRMFDTFSILSSDFGWIHENKNKDDWRIEDRKDYVNGTRIIMMISFDSQKTIKSVFDTYADMDFGFTKTHIPLFLAQYGDDHLISRSQAKRVLTRVEQFQEVILDFSGVEMIGQGFADEIFRVFKNRYPNIRFICVNANDDVNKMIRRVQICDSAL